MFERLNTPTEAYNYKLGAALNMEQTVLKILDSAIEEAQDSQVAALLRDHRAESEEHVRNLEQVFRMMDWEVDDSPCPAIDGLQAEAKANAKKTDKAIIDPILLQGAVEVEHHEIGVYENLISGARALGREDAAEVLARNLASEQAALDKARHAHDRVATVTPEHPADGGDGGVVNRIKDAVS